MTTGRRPAIDWNQIYSSLADAARDSSPVAGLTHNFYRYPARFAPGFAAAAIRCLSQPSDLVLDPFMGGGTTVVESIAAARSVIGNDLNSLAAFIARVKITPLSEIETDSLTRWALGVVPNLSYFIQADDVIEFIDPNKTKNLSLSRARFIKKVVAAALASLSQLPTAAAMNFARCAVLRVAQWALDGRERHTPLPNFRLRLTEIVLEMLDAVQAFGKQTQRRRAVILNMNASEIADAEAFAGGRSKAQLVVTSPPYPGVHVLYHRWQVDGRRETPAPYWIAGCQDGNGASFYNFADRRGAAVDKYFSTSLQALHAIRKVVCNGGYMVQMLAFNNPEEQLARYLSNMSTAGFEEIRVGKPRIWRTVPNRKWHATSKGATNSASEVVLIHKAV
jgi:DNA modification methylase